MNWEVWTMPRKTSFCNGTLLCSDLRHCWPAGFLYVLVWLMILPLQLLRGGYDCSRALPHEEMLIRLEAELHNVIAGAAVGSLVMAVLCGIVIPMAVYAYLMSPRAVGLMHALPVKRSTQYFSHFTAGFGLLTGGNVLILLLSVLAQLPFGVVDWAALGQWLLLTELLELFFLALGTLCAMATGWLLAIPVLYAAVSFAALLMCTVVQFLQRWFYFGFQYTTYPDFVEWLTPIVKLTETVGFLDGDYIARNGTDVYWRSLSEQALPTAAIYAAAGLVLLGLGWLLYRKRPSEAAGDAIAFPWLRPITRWAVGLCGGLGLGLFLSNFVVGGGRSLVKLILCQIIMGLLCFLGTQMLLQKTFRVFRRSWKEAVVLAAALVALTLGIRQDLLGVQRRVPDEGQVDTVAVRVSYTDAGYCLTDDPEIIALTAELHRAILAQGPATDENDGYLDITINYVLKSGQELRRVYEIDKNSGTETYRLANRLLNTTQFRRYAVGLDQLKPEEESAIRGGYVEDSETGTSVELTREQAQELLLAAQQDVASAADTDVLADIGSSTKEASTDVVTVPTETSPSPWRYQIILYVTAADGGTRDRYLQMQRYCTRMQTFISGLDFANSTADVPATEDAS